MRPFDTLCRRAIPFCIAALLAAPMAHAVDDVAEKDKDKVTDLQGVKVRASTATQATVATKTDAPLIEVPQSVFVSVCYGELGCSWGNRRTAMASATYRW